MNQAAREIFPLASCRYHPDHPGVGVCMRCRTVICAACCTRVEGINHCHACLKALAARPASPRRARTGAPLAALVLVLGWLALFGMLWLTQGGLAW
jgi:hypothetical protein